MGHSLELYAKAALVDASGAAPRGHDVPSLLARHDPMLALTADEVAAGESLFHGNVTNVDLGMWMMHAEASRTLSSGVFSARPEILFGQGRSGDLPRANVACSSQLPVPADRPQPSAGYSPSRSASRPRPRRSRRSSGVSSQPGAAGHRGCRSALRSFPRRPARDRTRGSARRRLTNACTRQAIFGGAPAARSLLFGSPAGELCVGRPNWPRYPAALLRCGTNQRVGPLGGDRLPG